jgi:hypothetical protein
LCLGRQQVLTAGFCAIQRRGEEEEEEESERGAK